MVKILIEKQHLPIPNSTQFLKSIILQGNVATRLVRCYKSLLQIVCWV